MKKVFIYSVLIFSVAFVFADVKIGWVDGAQLMYSHEDMRVAQAELEKEQKRVQVEFESKVATLDSLRSEFDKSPRYLLKDNFLETFF